MGESSPRSDASTHNRTNDPRWQLALRIAASSSLGRSRLMVDFLLYVVDRHINDRSDEITEQQIGVLVFGRPEGYDTNEDNIVRSYARNLRKRIEEYFAKEGAEESLLLEIPRGGYAPIFSSKPAAGSLASSEPVEASYADKPLILNKDEAANTSDSPDNPTVEKQAEQKVEQHSERSFFSGTATGWLHKVAEAVRRRSASVALATGLILGVLVSSLFPKTWLKRIMASPAEIASKNLWSQLFSSKSDTFIVPSDDGLIIMQRLTERPVPLASYLNGSYRNQIRTDSDPGAAELLKLGGRRYTSVVDLDLASRLAQLSEVVPQRMVIRFARDLRMDDLRDGNAILIGSIEANPWIELFQPQLNFRFSIHADNDQPSGIVNVHPRPNEGLIYGTPGQDHTYGLIAYLPNLNSTGHVLIVAGLNTAGTQAAEAFLLTPSLMDPTLQRARLPGGGFQPFELLIGAGAVAANASAPQIVLERIGPS